MQAEATSSVQILLVCERIGLNHSIGASWGVGGPLLEATGSFVSSGPRITFSNRDLL